MHDDLKAAALAWVNGVREQLGRAPLSALPRAENPSNSGFKCPLAQAIAVDPPEALFYVYAAQVRLCVQISGEESRVWEYPKVVSEFVRVFDAGEIPELLP